MGMSAMQKIEIDWRAVAFMVLSALIGVLLAIATVNADAVHGSDKKPALPIARGEAYQFEMHWGFVDRLANSTTNTSLFMPFDGTITIDDGNPETKEGIHLISALLFESGGSYAEGKSDAIEKRRDNWALREFDPRITWRSSTTGDWDGIALAFQYERGSDPIVTINTTHYYVQMSMSQLKKLHPTIEIGSAGQKLEIGRFFNLSYRVYDLAIGWGYNRTSDKNPSGAPMLVQWDGTISIDEGAIVLMRKVSFENRTRNYSRGMDDAVYERGEYERSLAWRSSTIDDIKRGSEVDGLALNFVVPRGVNPKVSIEFNNGYQRDFALPPRFRDMHLEQELDKEGHFVHAHLHWCWFKVP